MPQDILWYYIYIYYIYYSILNCWGVFNIQIYNLLIFYYYQLNTDPEYWIGDICVCYMVLFFVPFVDSPQSNGLISFEDGLWVIRHNIISLYILQSSLWNKMQI